MEGNLLERLFKTWLKPKSILIAFLLLAILYVTVVSSVSGWDGVTLTRKSYIGIGACFLLVHAVYVAICLVKYRLPRPPKGYIGVLFSIDAETEKFYLSARHKLVSNFNESLENGTDIRLKALCVPTARIEKYILRKDSGIIQLLTKTNSAILVKVRYTTDDIDVSEHFQLKVHYDVLHPKFNQTAEEILSYDLSRIGSPLRNQRFEKKDSIDVFEFTTQTMVFACQYIIGFVSLLTGDGVSAVELLREARRTVLKNTDAGLDPHRLLPLVEDRLFASYCLVSAIQQQAFQEDSYVEHLHVADVALEKANEIHPDTYSYNLGKAYILVMLYQDGIAARKCIDQCKLSAPNCAWRYSDAFLCAYLDHSPGKVIAKYNTAFSYQYDNLVQLAHNIELSIEKEPERYKLHLAAGLVYNKVGDQKLARQHLSLYLSLDTKADVRSREKITKLIDAAHCEEACNHDCSQCLQLGA